MKLKLIALLLITFFLTSCGSRKRTTRTTTKQTPREVTVIIPKVEDGIKIIVPKKTVGDVKQTYIDKYSGIAIEEMHAYKIPASITLAQGILESRSGNSELTLKSNNHFGIKCHSGWSGGRTYHDDDKKGECFRVYQHPSNSFHDHSTFLSGRKRYSSLFKLKITDYKGWARGLQKAGYATDKSYPKKLIKIIEAYQLYKYDTLVMGGAENETYIKTQNSIVHIVVKGDTLYSISRRYNITVTQLKEINGIENNTISIGRQLKVTIL